MTKSYIKTFFNELSTHTPSSPFLLLIHWLKPLTYIILLTAPKWVSSGMIFIIYLRLPWPGVKTLYLNEEGNYYLLNEITFPKFQLILFRHFIMYATAEIRTPTLYAEKLSLYPLLIIRSWKNAFLKILL